MSARNDIRDQARDEDRRKRDEAKVQTLQGQIDEVRHLTRELLSRQVRLEEQLKVSEAGIAQHRITLEQHRHEVSQSAQARQMEEARVRQQISELSARIDDSTRPIRTIQAHLAELLEAVRRQRDEVGQDNKRFDEIHVAIDHLAAHGERQITVSQALRESIDTVRSETERLQRDMLRIDDGIKIVDQEARRRVAEVVQHIENVDARLTEDVSGIGALSLQIGELRDALQAVDPQFEVVREDIGRLNEEITRFNFQARERDDLALERIEDLRQQFEQRVEDLETLTEQRVERINARLEQLDELDRELAYRINLLEMRLDELNQVDQRLRREMWYLNEQRARLRFEQAQHELELLIESRRDAEQSTANERSGRRPQE